MEKFIGRKKELELLKGLFQKKDSSLVVIRGRRRIGKSRLAEEYAKSFSKSFILSGIPPMDGINAATQREEFLRQLQEYKLPIYHSEDWGISSMNLLKSHLKGAFLLSLMKSRGWDLKILLSSLNSKQPGTVILKKIRNLY